MFRFFLVRRPRGDDFQERVRSVLPESVHCAQSNQRKIEEKSKVRSLFRGTRGGFEIENVGESSDFNNVFRNVVFAES